MGYSIGHIYKIICRLDSNFVYIGSTFNELKQRWTGHKEQYKQYLKDGGYNMSTHKYYTKYGIQNFKIILIKSYKVIRESQRDNAHLRVYEQLWLNKTKKAVNIHKAFNPLVNVDRQIYNENNKEKRCEKNKEYRENNKEKVKEYYLNNKEKIKENNKEYRENNKEKIKEYRENNKEKRNEKITCDCGSIITKAGLLQHKKSKKHLKLMQNK
jgi:hypothetical protein